MSPQTRYAGFSPALRIWLGYLIFVIYGSLVPLDFRPLPLENAWAIFQQTPMLRLGVESRADWIANGVLYVPVGFLTAYLLTHARSIPYILSLLSAMLFSAALALGIEFTQVFFPSRTVSLNDLLAEFIGSGLGVLLATHCSEWLRNLLHVHIANPRKLLLHAMEAYLVGYIAFSLFPYDILLSTAELAKKLGSDAWGWLFAGDSGAGITGVFKLAAEFLLTVPFGLYLGYRSMKRPASIRQAALSGALLGGVIELAQFFMASGVSQGISIVTRLAGTCAGLALWQRRTELLPDRLAAGLRRHAVLLVPAYFLTLLLASGWFSYRWRGLDSASSQLAGLNFLPFYYHYYTTEARALLSLASVCLLYLPIGLMIWAKRGTPGRALWIALITACVVEAGKLFLQGTHADPTNILLAALAAWGAAHLSGILARAIEASPATAREQASPAPQPRVEQDRSDRPPGHWKTTLAYAALFPLLAFCIYRAATFPAMPVMLVLLLMLCAILVWHRPARLFLIIPLLLPVLDLAPWSGRFYFDEFDLLIITGLAVGFARIPPVTRPQPRDTAGTLILAGVAASLICATLIALLPWPASNPNAFISYFSPFNALRIGKGALWAFLCFALLQRLQAQDVDFRRQWSLGMAGGLALTVSVVFWERLTFSSLLDFSSDYRITGPISAMHTGGAYIECLLAVATPFLLLLIWQTRSLAHKLLGLGLLLATTYALMVTYSRNGYVAFAAALAIFLFLASCRSGSGWRRGFLVMALSICVLAVAIPVFTGQFAQQRLARMDKDLAVRESHWNDALDLRAPGGSTTLFGMGLGRFPASRYLYSSDQDRTGSYQLRTENENTFLRLVSGEALYVEQIVDIDPGRKHVLKMKARSKLPGEKLGISLCEKWMLTSFNCLWINLNINSTDNEWIQLETPFDASHLSLAAWYFRKPVKLSLHTPAGTPRHIDIDDIRLETRGKENLIRNGNFSTEMDHWFFSTDNHLNWHAKSLPVAVLFDQGWLGLAAVLALALIALKRSAGRAWHGDLHAAATLAAFTAFLITGLFDTLIDAPRFLFLFLMLGGMPLRWRHVSKSL